MRFRRTAPAALIAAVFVVVAVMAWVSSSLFSGLTRSVEKTRFDTMLEIVQGNLRGTEDRAIARAEMLADLPEVRAAFAARDRDRLLADLAPMFKTQHEKYGVDQVQFIVPPATSFLRLQAPTLFGDDLTKFRPLVVAVNQDQVSRKAPTIARTGPGVFGVVPVHDPAGAYTGIVEVGMDFGVMLDGFKSAYGLEAALLIDEESLRSFASGVAKDKLDEQNRVGAYLKFHATHWDLLRKLVTSRDVTGMNEPVRYTRVALGVPYGVLLVPFTNAAGRPIGVIAVAEDFSASRAAAGRSLVWQALIALFAIVLLTGVILVVLRGFLLRPLGILGERFGDLAAGRTAPAVADTDGWSSELQELAAHHETLRQRAAGEGGGESS
jgi:methyl-accepting chemotaxis protein